jgi:hypothetical protein
VKAWALWLCAAATAAAVPAAQAPADTQAVVTYFAIRAHADVRRPWTPQEQAAVNRYWELRDEDRMRHGARLVAAAIDEFVRVLPASDGALLRSMRFRIVADTDVNARLDPHTREVRLPVGSIRASEWASEAMEDIDDDAELLLHADDYVAAQTPHLYKPAHAQDEKLVFPLWRFAGRPAPPRSPAREREVAELIEAHLYNALAFLVAHEFCHLKLGHGVLGGGREAIAQERAADGCALAAMKRAEFTPNSAVTLLQWMSAAATAPDGSPRFSATHPHPACRFNAVYAFIEREYAGAAARNNEPAFRASPEPITLGQLQSLVQPLLHRQKAACDRHYGGG